MDSFTLRIDGTLLDRARATADVQHTTVTQLFIDGLWAELDRRAYLQTRAAHATNGRVYVMAALEIPTANDCVIAIQGNPSGTAAGCAVLDVRNISDFELIPITDYTSRLRHIQLVCTKAQFEPLLAWLNKDATETTTEEINRLLYLLARFRARETFSADEAGWGFATGTADRTSLIARESDELDALLAKLLPNVSPHPNSMLD